MIILTEAGIRQNLFPFTHTRHTADIRIGILTIREKWEMLTGDEVSTDDTKQGISVPANLIPTPENFEGILQAVRNNLPVIESDTVKYINHPWHIFLFNDYALKHDFSLATKGKKSEKPDQTNKVINPENIFLEPGAKVSHSILNASAGPIYIGKNAEIMEGNMIRGSFSLGGNSVLKMGSKIYGSTTIGPNCVAGGEIKNSVLFGNSNKAHDGYLGDSVLGEWCNLGAGSSNSNVKNTGGEVYFKTGENTEDVNAGNKAGLLMGDYSRCAINTSFNTGSTVGVCCNIFGENTLAKYSENFTWGNEKYIFEKAVEHIENWKKMKNQLLTSAEKEILKKLYNDNSWTKPPDKKL